MATGMIDDPPMRDQSNRELAKPVAAGEITGHGRAGKISDPCVQTLAAARAHLVDAARAKTARARRSQRSAPRRGGPGWRPGGRRREASPSAAADGAIAVGGEAGARSHRRWGQPRPVAGDAGETQDDHELGGLGSRPSHHERVGHRRRCMRPGRFEAVKLRAVAIVGWWRPLGAARGRLCHGADRTLGDPNSGPLAAIRSRRIERGSGLVGLPSRRVEGCRSRRLPGLKHRLPTRPSDEVGGDGRV